MIDIGGPGGMVEGTRAQRFVDAINATAIGVTASLNGDGVTVDLVNDTAGTAGNVDITETVSNESFVVTGMSGGAGGAGPVPEFSQIAYLLVLAFGGFYVLSKIKSSQAIDR